MIQSQPRAIAFPVILAGLATLVAATAPAQPGAAPRIPLREGLTIVTALNEPERGDYESIKTITHTDAKAVRLKYAAEVPARAGGDDNPLAAIFGGGKPAAATKKPDGSETEIVRTTRTIRREDLENATEYRHYFATNAPDLYPGSTAVGVSRRVLTNLKEKGESPLTIPPGGLLGGLTNLLDSILGGAGANEAGTMLSGTLKRVEKTAVPFKVLVNDQPVELMAIHAQGTLGDLEAEFWILDDPENPLSLRWQIDDGRLQVIRLSFPVEETTTAAGGRATGSGGGAGAGAGAGAGGGGAGAGAGGGGANPAAGTSERIAADLAKEGRAIVYGIYFDFASDRIKEESEPVLAEIAEVLRDNPTWSLAVEGHTDSIGGDAYNLNLSRRRSAAVKQALTTRYKIEPARLETSGHGASRPKDTNDTMEGRARNRRVELVKAG